MSERYMPTHEWARLDGALVAIGLSAFAAGEVGEVIHIALPKPGQKLTRGQACAEIESVKSVNDYYSPVDGEVAEVNQQLVANPELLNQDAANAWFAKVKPSAKDPLAGLLTKDEYAAKTAK
ncbi:MAG TPA: glycine cleavage system protein GcvH [Planctomycetota bacterium]|nr:glycine cleavage system protein GcvH [Planctomycetota bacterium]